VDERFQDVDSADGDGANPEVPEKTTRQTFGVRYKLRILQEADRRAGPSDSVEGHLRIEEVNMTTTDISAAPSRRSFLKSGSLTAAGTWAGAGILAAARPVHAAGSDALKVGLIGAGGRGTRATMQALKADPGARLTAVADAFEDRLQMSLRNLHKSDEIRDRIDVPAQRQFVGFDAYRRVLESGVDVVLLATPPHFRPEHIRAAVEHGVHVFAEKPVAVDAPGVRSVLESSELAVERQIAMVSGLCLRYSYEFRDTIGRVHDGAIGKIHTLQANDYRGELWRKPRQPDWSDMQWQMRNWLYFTWLSGDFNVEQHIHMLDTCSWLVGDRYPVKAIGVGGRQKRTGPEYGNVFDHHSVVYEYDDGTKLFATTRQMDGCKYEMSTEARGESGSVYLSKTKQWIENRQGTWRYKGTRNDRYQTEHDELFASIRNGEPINNGNYMANSTMLAIMGRMATYTGQEITWDRAIQSQERLGPDRYQWEEAPQVVIAVPGQTRFS